MSDREAELPSGLNGWSIQPLLVATRDDGSLLVEEGFTLAPEHEIESIFATGNGYVGTRASLEEGSPRSWPATLAAGVYVDDAASDLRPTLAVFPARAQPITQGERWWWEVGFGQTHACDFGHQSSPMLQRAHGAAELGPLRPWRTPDFYGCNDRDRSRGASPVARQPAADQDPPCSRKALARAGRCSS